MKFQWIAIEQHSSLVPKRVQDRKASGISVKQVDDTVSVKNVSSGRIVYLYANLQRTAALLTSE
jgi:hypothetical protein